MNEHAWNNGLEIKRLRQELTRLRRQLRAEHARVELWQARERRAAKHVANLKQQLWTYQVGRLRR